MQNCYQKEESKLKIKILNHLKVEEKQRIIEKKLNSNILTV